MPALERPEIGERALEPATQLACAERGGGEVQVVPQRVRRLASRLGLKELQMARRGRVVAQRRLVAEEPRARRSQRSDQRSTS